MDVTSFLASQYGHVHSNNFTEMNECLTTPQHKIKLAIGWKFAEYIGLIICSVIINLS